MYTNGVYELQQQPSSDDHTSSMKSNDASISPPLLYYYCMDNKTNKYVPFKYPNHSFVNIKDDRETNNPSRLHHIKNNTLSQETQHVRQQPDSALAPLPAIAEGRFSSSYASGMTTLGFEESSIYYTGQSYSAIVQSRSLSIESNNSGEVKSPTPKIFEKHKNRNHDAIDWHRYSDGTRQITRHLYDCTERWIKNVNQYYPLFLFAIPKYKRCGTPNKLWTGGVLRVHGMLHKKGLPRSMISTNNKSSKIAMTDASPPAQELRLLRDGVLWETYVDVLMIPLGTDHLNGDSFFACPLPIVPTYEATIKSLEVSCQSMSPEETKNRFEEASAMLESTSMDECIFTIRCLPFECQEVTQSNKDQRALAELRIEEGVPLRNGIHYDGRIAKSLWNKIPHSLDSDFSESGDCYEFNWSASAVQDRRDTIVTLRDGVLDEGNSLCLNGIALRLNLSDRRWRHMQPYLHYFDETDGTWREKDFNLEWNRPDRSFIVANLHVRRMLFVIGDRLNRKTWLKAQNQENFHIPFAGAYEVFPSGHLIHICGGALAPQRTLSVSPSTRALQARTPDKVDFFTLEDDSDPCVTDMIPPLREELLCNGATDMIPTLREDLIV